MDLYLVHLSLSLLFPSNASYFVTFVSQLGQVSVNVSVNVHLKMMLDHQTSANWVGVEVRALIILCSMYNEGFLLAS